MIKKADPSVNLRFTSSVYFQINLNIRFFCFSYVLRRSFHFTTFLSSLQIVHGLNLHAPLTVHILQTVRYLYKSALMPLLNKR